MKQQSIGMILAAGKGTRLEKLTATKPKALLEINGITLLERVINQLIAAGISEAVINVHHFADQIKAFLAKADFKAIRLQISDESDQLMDTGGGILQAGKYFQGFDAVLIHNVDVLSDLNLQLILEEFQKAPAMAWLLTQERASSRKLLFDTHNQLCGWKNLTNNQFKWVEAAKSDYKEQAFSGIHLFKPQLFEHVPIQKVSVIDLYLNLARQFSIASKPIKTNYWFDLGKKNQVEEIDLFFQQQEA
ncbi:MAG: NTP transferase domain-containing protein [Bacteroidales bacterium]|nr:NTP transferase domain-containing protein [Bacteroidales bacterium]